MHVSGWAKRFLFRAEQLQTPVRYLSGGEQARILIAQLMLQPADVLILDEPTNDLDIPTLEVLEESLVAFPGALVLVTHDRYLLDSVSTQLLALDGRAARATSPATRSGRRPSDPTRPRPRRSPPPRPRPPTAPSGTTGTAGMTAAERREWKGIEERIEAAEETVRAVRAEMETQEVATDAARLQDAWRRLGEAEEAVTRLYTRWEELEAKVR